MDFEKNLTPGVSNDGPCNIPQQQFYAYHIGVQASFGAIPTLGVAGSRQTPICVDRAVYPVDSIPMEVAH